MKTTRKARIQAARDRLLAAKYEHGRSEIAAAYGQLTTERKQAADVELKNAREALLLAEVSR